jgi:hypothetical protein
MWAMYAGGWRFEFRAPISGPSETSSNDYPSTGRRCFRTWARYEPAARFQRLQAQPQPGQPHIAYLEAILPPKRTSAYELVGGSIALSAPFGKHTELA